MAVYNKDLNLINTNKWDSNQKVFKNMVAVYTVTDTIPLFLNKEKMMASTIIHHICVFLSYIYIIKSENDKVF